MIHFSLSKAPGSGSACEPSPCGPHSKCRIIDNNRPVCSCLPGYTGPPLDCRKREPSPPEDYSCTSKNCGPNSICHNNERGNAVCQCEPGYHFAIEGIFDVCIQCVHKSECGPNQTCASGHKCADVCGADVCGPNDECYVFDHKASCRPKGVQPKCSSHTDCASHEACDGYKCVDPCLDACDLESTVCKVTNHEATCTCKTGFVTWSKWACSQIGLIL